jgi:hypothetical protein
LVLRGDKMPNGAEFRRALNSEQRGIPNSAESRTALNAKTREALNGASALSCTALFCPARSGPALCSLFGIPRRSRFSAVRDSAPFGIQRSSEFGAVRDSAPFGIPRRLARRLARRLDVPKKGDDTLRDGDPDRRGVHTWIPPQLLEHCLL